MRAPQSELGRKGQEIARKYNEVYDLYIQGIRNASENMRNAAYTEKTTDEGGARMEMAREHIKDQLKNNLDTLREMQPVKQISEETIANVYNSDKSDRLQRIRGIIRNYRKGVYTQNFGTVKLDEDSVADILSHGSTFERFVVFEAVPQVLKHGKKVAEYIDESKSTITISAPIMFGKHRINVGVLVSQNNHKVYGYNFTDENGNKFQYEKGAIPTLYAPSLDESNETTINGIAPTNSIPDSSEKGNTSDNNNLGMKQSRDADYLSAVNRGDMKTAQKMVDEAAKEAGREITKFAVSEMYFDVSDDRWSPLRSLRECRFAARDVGAPSPTHDLICFAYCRHL